MKQYVATPHALNQPLAPVFDLGRGTGHDLVLAELVRCTAGGALVTVFEPDWTHLCITSTLLDDQASWLSSVKQPDIGARL